MGIVVGDRYQVCRRVGDGGMARVYLAWDTRLRLWCALKILTRKAVEDPVMRTRFVHEARALARLTHQNLVRFYDLGGEVVTPYMAMEFAEGGTVAARLSHGALPPRLATRLAADLAGALVVAHQGGVVHRDLKPQNLLLDRHGVVKLSDFGVARVDRERRLTASNLSIGTLAYMPPEQERDAAKVDETVDIYALGATLWAMVVGRRPVDLVTRQRDRTLAMLPPELEPVVRTATALQASERYADAGAFEVALREALAHLPPDPAGPALVLEPTLLPQTPPAMADFVAEPGEFEGTGRPWKEGTSASGAPGSKLATLLLVEPSEAPTRRVRREGEPEPDAEPDAEPPPPRAGFARLALLALLAFPLVACAGTCAGFSAVGATAMFLP